MADELLIIDLGLKSPIILAALKVHVPAEITDE